jgi:hypothetical protein
VADKPADTTNRFSFSSRQASGQHQQILALLQTNQQTAQTDSGLVADKPEYAQTDAGFVSDKPADNTDRFLLRTVAEKLADSTQIDSGFVAAKPADRANRCWLCSRKLLDSTN